MWEMCLLQIAMLRTYVYEEWDKRRVINGLWGGHVVLVSAHKTFHLFLRIACKASPPIPSYLSVCLEFLLRKFKLLKEIFSNFAIMIVFLPLYLTLLLIPIIIIRKKYVKSSSIDNVKIVRLDTFIWLWTRGPIKKKL